MLLEIISPEKTLFQGKIQKVKLPGKKGSFEVLKDHAPMLSVLSKGLIVITLENGEKEFIENEYGFAEILENKIIVLV
jgi:F-type H+-transporting ATPase subunit epsilon